MAGFVRIRQVESRLNLSFGRTLRLSSDRHDLIPPPLCTIKGRKMKTSIKLIFLSNIIFCFLSCDKKNDNEIVYKIPNFTSTQTEFSDDELLNATYSNYKFPSNFYHENLGDTNLYYVNTLSIDSAENGKSIQLSTNSFEKAKDWSIKSTYENSEFKNGINSEKFFEFIRITNPEDNSIIKFRTHKSSYLTRDNYNFFNKSDTIGIFKKLNFSVDDTKELIDYLWFISNYNNRSEKILSSFAVDNQQIFEVYHYELHIVYGDFNLYDEITLIKKVYEIERNTGVITVTETIIRKINGEYN